jgi:proteasome accessory factor PafA2
VSTLAPRPRDAGDAAPRTQGFVGIETEYGIAVTGPEEINAVRASALLVGAYRELAGGDVGWDYTEEQPDRDARSTPLRPPPRELVIDDRGTVNLVLTNGARLYVDHAHPEYATPECASARDAVVWDVAGERIVEAAARYAEERLPEGSVVHVHKNNTDGKGAAYGTHENYLVDRAVPFGLLTRHLLPMFVSRSVLVGAGRVGSEHGDVDFQVSQRADFFEVDIGLETTSRRPIMNTRDEPHADPDRFRRLHVINGDANPGELATYVKVGAMLLVLDAVAGGMLPEPIELDDPVAAFRTFSHDPTLRATVRSVDGRSWRALDLQEHYFEHARRSAERLQQRADDVDVLAQWESMLTAARSGPEALVGLADWATKLELIEAFRARHALSSTHDRVRMVDLQYHDVRRDKGLHHRLVAAGRVSRITTDEEIAVAVRMPPEDTRAWFRGECVRRFPDAVVAAGWDSVVLDLGGEDGLVRLPMPEPGLGTRALTGSALETAADVTDLLRLLDVQPELPGQLA